jgi:hypothetical protein
MATRFARRLAVSPSIFDIVPSDDVLGGGKLAGEYQSTDRCAGGAA